MNVNVFYAIAPKIYQYMGDLPISRVNMTFPFIKPGIDYAGPVDLKQRQRKAQAVKAYMALFVCIAMPKPYILNLYLIRLLPHYKDL